ncbi:MAG TPA: hypothetical protein VH044_16960 [Polyangiaceae bacterium]|nr:hypothetical protein [Polyangiaceae bacterium]
MSCTAFNIRLSRRTRALAPWIAALAIGPAFGCSSRPWSSDSPPSTVDGGAAANAVSPDVDGGADVAAPPMPFQADPPSVYVAKVKNVLVGLPATDQEIGAVSADPEQLGGLVDGWMKLPQYEQKMLRFFELAFQQTQVGPTDFSDQVYPGQIGFNPYTIPQLTQNAQESFARTMIQLLAQGQPLTTGMTTQQFMMTTAMKELYAFLDAWQVDDDGVVTDRFQQAFPNATLTVEASQGAIPVEESVDPTSPNFMRWYDPDVAAAGSQAAGCQADPLVYPPSATSLHYLLYGSLDAHPGATGACGVFAGSAGAAQLRSADFDDWTMVTVRPPNAGEAATPFWNLPALRSATELVLQTPRVGFFSTPAFFANWHTNISNQARATTNQALIVATGASISPTDKTDPHGEPGLDATHANQVACFSCHKTLDPTRSIFAATYSWNYHSQLDPTWAQQPGMFAFEGFVQPVHTMVDFGNTLASHPMFASGWTQKLCYYVDSAPCAAADLQQLAGVFQGSGYSWNALVKALVTSPVTTNTVQTATTAVNGEVVGVSRRDHLCAALDTRLGYKDLCGLQATSGGATQQAIPAIVSGLPSDAYGRGAAVPVLPTQPTLFYRGATENICTAIAAQLVDAVDGQGQAPAGLKQWSSAQPDAAIADFVGIVMGLAPSDPRSAAAGSLLRSHFTTAMGQPGASATLALQSTFVVACLAPSAVSIGM